MRLASVVTSTGSRAALLVDGELFDLAALVPEALPGGVRDVMPLLQGDAPVVDVLASRHATLVREIRAGAHRETSLGPRSGVRLAAPIARPGKILCAGLNYADHVREIGASEPERPLVFAKLPTAVAGPDDDIVLPTGRSRQVDYEIELAVVIGRTVSGIDAGSARSAIAGYMVCNDVSARDWQFDAEGQLTLGKGFDTFFPTGPWLTTLDEVADPDALWLETRIGDEVVQSSSTAHLLRRTDWLVAWLSTVCTLEPGDVIATGTPAGVGVSRTPPRFLRAGDVVSCEIEELGRLVNRCVDEKGARR
jgi:2-keto-4-pentenoate hydratase/2-oxohepta-3-ene-1,7-dioic acid hydratase in catechol pathway